MAKIQLYKPNNDSTLVEQMGYNPEDQILRLKLINNNDSYYDYSNIPISIYAGLQVADHPGSYYNRFIKGRFDCSTAVITDDTDDGYEKEYSADVDQLAQELLDKMLAIAVDKLKLLLNFF